MFKGTLWPYQQEAVDRMVDRGQMLLGMVMGAGKTPTALGAIEELHAQGEVSRCLVVAPSSLKYQWNSEIGKFTNGSRVVIDGTKAKREQQWRTSISARYVIVNPETLLNDVALIGTFQAMIIDESTMIKNRGAKRSKLLKRIGKAIPYRYALTGQPIENRPEELYSIMEFVDKDVLGDFKLFDRTFIVRDNWGKAVRYRNLDKMYKTMQECMVRKTRDDIKDQLPDIIHQTIPVQFDTAGAHLYRLISNDLLAQISEAMSKGKGGFSLWAHYNSASDGEAQGQIMSRLTVLRMLCDNPELISVSANNYDDEDTKAGSEYASTLAARGLLVPLKDAPKLDACMDYIESVLEESPDNKVVLFSFFKQNLALIKKRLDKVTDSVLFTGDMNALEKDAAKKKFQTAPSCRVFLSSDAGGYGVDLPMANYLISYDLPWSSGKLEQREARIIRLSSQFPHVTIATFVMKGSIEERQYEMLQVKRSINEAFIDGKHVDNGGSFVLDINTLSSFLRDSKV